MNIIKNLKSVFRTTDKIIWMDINNLIVDPEFERIFVQKESEISNISANIQERGFDPAHPVILTLSKVHPELNNIIADGYTRYKASLRAGINKVAVIYKDFADREDLLKFVYEQQLLRRNLSETEIFNSWEALNSLTNKDGKKSKSDTEIAEELHISRRQVAKMKEVSKKDPESVALIKAGSLSLNQAYTKIKDAESVQKDEESDVEKNANQTSDTEVKLVSPNQEPKLQSVKIPKPSTGDYGRGFTEGLLYVLDCLNFGKHVDEIKSELSEVKTGAKSVDSLKESLIKLKESHEQKQAE